MGSILSEDLKEVTIIIRPDSDVMPVGNILGDAENSRRL